jgi:hypothetical protein
MLRLAAITAAIFVANFDVASAADEWGDLSLRFVYDGQPPEPRKVPIDRDRAVCKEAQIDESLVVSATDRGIASVVVWLTQGKDGAEVPIHPAYEQSAKAEVSLTVKSCRYEPHVVLVRSSQVLVFKNLDPIAYNFSCQLARNQSFNFIAAPSREAKVEFEGRESVPAPVASAIHPWMNAWLFIHDNPYMAVSDASGTLKILNVPTGKRTFRVWHERSGYVRQLTRSGEMIELPREGLAVDVKAGANDLGELLLKPEVFEPKK